MKKTNYITSFPTQILRTTKCTYFKKRVERWLNKISDGAPQNSLIRSDYPYTFARSHV